MNDILTFSLSVFTGLIAMMNPIANIPAFLGLVGNYPADKQAAIAKKACIVAFVILVGFVLLGKFIFSIFGITIPAFKITGGLLIFKIGFDMLQSKSSNIKNTGDTPPVVDSNIAISPLAIPLLAGPGTIVTAMDFVSNTTFTHLIVVAVVSLVVIIINYFSLRSGDFIVAKLGHNVISVLDKIMGLILAIMGTGMVIAGIKLAF
ncbi:MarC family protein [Riemerella columbina]|uniref:MarC family protein n=1 Tax=Riemerella columbina TaxID=103810 RepID=UPI00267003A1|nr:MarC family protein [Riemerella columbina]WKS95618.1 MarC family protein [Riemerella columbina]